MLVDILSLFPGYFQGPFDESMIKRAREEGILNIRQTNIRDYASGKHRQVDDRPYGGGPGMVLMAEPVLKAIEAVRSPAAKVIHLSPQGPVLTAEKAEQLAQEEHLVFLCGHYEGIDERALSLGVDEELSIGDYVLTSGCAAAIVVVDAVCRFIPGVLGHQEAAQTDSFHMGGFDHPHYTRPEVCRGERVPEVLLSGDHGKIAEWRMKQAKEKTKRVRPDLLLKQD